jgi:hypothetical protein
MELVPSDSFVPFFSDPALAEQFRAIWRTWDRTPFAEHSRVRGPGGGCDCVAVQEETLFEVGAVPRFHFPRSDGDYKSHLHNTKMLSFLRGKHEDPQSLVLAERFAELTNLDELVPKPKWPERQVFNTGLMTGDVLVIKALIPGVWHLAAMQDDRHFMHCAYPLGVTEADITQADYRDQLKAVFRCRAWPPSAILDSQSSL